MKGEVVCATLMVVLLCCVVSGQSQGEIDALVDLYDSTGGPEWRNNRNWLEGSPCSNHWFGIFCDKTPSVTIINLNGNLLTGTISSTLSNLTSLKDLYVILTTLIGLIGKF